MTAVGLDESGPGGKLGGAGLLDGLQLEEGWEVVEVRISEAV